MNLFQKGGVTPSDINRWNKSVRRGSRTFSICLLPQSSRNDFSAMVINVVGRHQGPEYHQEYNCFDVLGVVFRFLLRILLHVGLVFHECCGM